MRSRVAFAVFLMMCFFRQSSFCDTWPLVLTGQIAPGTGEARFASLSQAAVNSRGDIAFHAGLVGGGPRHLQGIRRDAFSDRSHWPART